MFNIRTLCGGGAAAACRCPEGAPSSWRWLPVCAVLAFLVFTSGCKTYEPRPLDPSAEWKALTDLRQSLSLVPEGDAPAAEPEWFPTAAVVDLADGLSLAEANAVALYHNPALVQARHRVSVSESQLLQAGLLENPSLFLGPRFSTSGSEVIFPASLSWELPLWGRRGARRDAADSASRATILELQGQEIEVLVAVRSTYLDLWAVTQEVEALTSLKRTAELVLAWIEQLRDAGEIDQTTLWLASWEQSQFDVQLRTKNVERRRHIYRLYRLLGLLPTANVDVVSDGSQMLPDLAITTLEQRKRHPRLRIAEETYKGTEARLRLAIAEQYPTVRLGPEFEDDDSDAGIGFGLGIDLPLFDRNQGQIAAAEALRDAARDQYRAVLLGMTHEEAQARLTAESAAELLEVLRTQSSRSVDAAMEALEARLELGMSNVVEVLTAGRALADARLQQARLEVELARATLAASVASGLAFREPVVDEHNQDQEGQ